MTIPLDSPLARRRGRAWRIRYLWTPLVALVILVGVVARRPIFQSNFGIVEPGKVFRSAQPSRVRLRRMISDRELRSVLNLRGGSFSDLFYDEEVQVTGRHDVDFYDFPMSPDRRPTRNEILTLLDLFDRCEYPLLIHCKQGADRTGLASALYRLSRNDTPPEVAIEEFSARYGHIPLRWPLGGTAYLHDPIDEYAGWLASHKLTHSPARLRAWVETDYRTADSLTEFRQLRPGPRKALVRSDSMNPPTVR